MASIGMECIGPRGQGMLCTMPRAKLSNIMLRKPICTNSNSQPPGETAKGKVPSGCSQGAAMGKTTSVLHTPPASETSATTSTTLRHGSNTPGDPTMCPMRGPRHGQGLKRRPPATAQAAEVRNKSRRPRPLRQRDALNQRRRRHNNDKRTLTKQALPWRHIDRKFQEKTKIKIDNKDKQTMQDKSKTAIKVSWGYQGQMQGAGPSTTCGVHKYHCSLSAPNAAPQLRSVCPQRKHPTQERHSVARCPCMWHRRHLDPWGWSPSNRGRSTEGAVKSATRHCSKEVCEVAKHLGHRD
jgi:hypothetical protein